MIKNLGYGKISKCHKAPDSVYLSKLEDIINSIIKQNPNHIVKIFEFSKIELSYSYVMEELKSISNTDKEIISRYRDIKHKFHKRIHDKYLVDNIYESLFNANDKLVKFLDFIVLEDRYWDLHKNNVRIDYNNDYRLIDIEGFIKPKFDYWIDPNIKWEEYVT